VSQARFNFDLRLEVARLRIYSFCVLYSVRGCSHIFAAEGIVNHVVIVNGFGDR
jgi:hypothetical protein